MFKKFKERKYYFIYKTTNLINKKYYIGMHQTDNLNDDYLGSGKYLQSSIKKYGVKNFKREILEFCKNRDELIKKEKEIVNEDILKDALCMNLNIGGLWSDENSLIAARMGGKATWKKLKSDKNLYNNHINKLSLANKGKQFFLGKHHTKKTIEKLRLSHIGKHIGNKNSQFGTCWIYNLELKENKKIKKEELNFWLNKNWIKGRKVKF